MKSTEFNISFINHDLKNYIGVALAHIQLLTMDSPSLIKDKDIIAIVESLNSAIELSEEIAMNSDSEITLTKGKNLVSIDVRAHLRDNVKPRFDGFKKMHNNISIIDTYEILDIEKYLAINPVTLKRTSENIISNAINAGATALNVSYEMKNDYLIVTFKDNGKGMSQDELDNFVTLLLGDGKIHGLGSKILFNTADEHGFYLSCNSEVGIGTTIRALCPYVNA